MGIYLDSADLTEVIKVEDYPFVEGISCNPKLIAKAMKKDEISQHSFLDHIIKLSQAVKGNIFVQTNFYEVSEIIQEARKIQFILEDRAIIKLPYTKEGLKASRILKGEHIRTCITGLFTPIQSYVCGYMGSSFISPYCNQITESGSDGIKTIAEIMDIYRSYGFNTKILAASVKSIEEVAELLKAGAHHITMPLHLIEDIMFNQKTNEVISKFKDCLKIV